MADDLTTNTGESEADAAYILAFVSNAIPVFAIVLSAAILYRGHDVFLPLTLAIILAVIFTPACGLLESYLGRFFSAALVVLVAIGAVAAIGYFLTVELTATADKISGYSANIANKLGALEKTSPPWLQHLKQAVSDVQRRLDKGNSGGSQEVIQTTPAPPSTIEKFRPILPVLDGLVQGLLITVLMFFLLYSRKDLRDRLVRLVARARILIAPQAIETAAETVGHYLLLFSAINFSFGLACGLTAWALGVPSAPLWGLLAFLLRFVPYVGAITAAILPAVVAFAVFPGWARSLEVVGAFILFDQIAAQFIEPFVVGRGIDVSPTAILISAMFWSWLWGIPGLLLATPLTACLKVAGDYVPALGFFSVLLGADRKLEDYHDFYRLLLEQDSIGARELAIGFCDRHGLERTFDEVLTPALSLSGEERSANHISEEIEQSLIETIRELIEDLGKRYVKSSAPDSLRVLGVCAAGEVHSLGLLMVIELLRHAGAATKVVEEAKSTEELRTVAKKFAPHLVCISCTTTDCLPSAVEAIAALRKDFSELAIFAGGKAALWDASKMIEAGCDEVCGSREEARRAVRQFAVRRAKGKSPIIRRAAIER
jgi:predicted PurR-regulated permease PerM/methanogenic corrinoid protein MtbC1